MKFKKLMTIIFGIVFTVLSYAAPPVNVSIPSSVDPGRIQLKFPSQIAPPSAAKVQTPKQPSTQLPLEEAKKYKFKLTRVTFTGNTIFTQAQLAPIFQPFINKEITLADLQNLTNEITNKYRNAGYILSRAILPPQTIKNGEVKIQIIEGFIEKVSVTGTPGRAKKLLEAYGQKIEQSRPLNIKTLERYVLLANDIQGSTVRAVLKPSETTPGAADLNLVAELKKFGGTVSYDNFGSRYLGPEQYTFRTQLNSLMRAGDSTVAQVLITPNTNQMRYVGVEQIEPIGTNGLSLSLGASYAHSQPGLDLDTIDVVGQGKTFRADLQYPLIRSRNQSLFVHSGFTYLDSRMSILGSPFYNDKLRVLTLGGNYSFNDAFKGSNLIKIDVDQGLNVLGASHGNDISRPNGHINFTKLDFLASRLQFLTSRFSTQLALHAQYAFQPLLASEQFGFGGSEFGRGYDPSEVTGDRGIDGKIELQMNTWPDRSLLKAVQYYTFYDAGVLWNIDTQNNPSQQDATSAGVGARINFNNYLEGNLYLAKPLTLPSDAQIADGKNGKAMLGYFQVRVKF